jgi:DNA ligase (NAD+)
MVFLIARNAGRRKIPAMNGRHLFGCRPALAHTAVLALLLLCIAALPAASPAVPAPASSPSPASNTRPAVAIAPGSSGEARARIAELRAKIAHHDELYFRRAAPEISDSAYDSLKRELAALERDFPSEVAAASPGAAALGDDRTGDFPTWRHRERMLGLDKTYSKAELRNWHRQLLARLGHGEATLVVEPKFDGLAVSVTYEHGRLVRAVTRGDGNEGDDITANLSTIATLPATLYSSGPQDPPPDRIELRGEVYVSWAEFARLNRELGTDGEPAFAHPRTLAAGTAKLLDPAEVATRKLEVVFYGWGACEPAAATPASQRGFLSQARAWGLPTVGDIQLAHDADELWLAVQNLGRLRATFGYPADGAVVKVDSVALRRALGETEQAPRWAVAYKFAPRQATTELRGITIQVGRTGVLTPVAELAPVSIAGATVTRATLHNRDTIARLDLRVGDSVVVERAGEIVPRIVGVDRTRRRPDRPPFAYPEQCPSCGTAVVQLPSEAAVRCPNSACPAQLRRRLDHFTGASGVDIRDLGPATVNTLVDRGLVREVSDLYRLRRTDLTALPGFGGPSADALLAAIEQSRHARLWRVLSGLGLPRVGVTTAKRLALRFDSLEGFANATFGELLPVVGPSTAREVVAYLAEPRNRASIDALVAVRNKP